MTERTNYGKLIDVIQPPDLIETQTVSYRDFLQMETAPSRRKAVGLQAVFKEVFPIESYDGQCSIDFVKYDIVQPKMTALECLREGESFNAPLYVTFRLKDANEVREEDVYMGEVPLMTDRGTFIVNGAERVVVSQLHRSPGICFETSVHTNGSILYSFRIIPDRGSWIEVQFDAQEYMYVYLDRRRRRRKFLAPTFLRALGYGSDDELLSLYYDFETLSLRGRIAEEKLANRVLKGDVVDVDSQSVLARAYDPLTAELVEQIKAAGYKQIDLVNVTWDGGLFMQSVAKDPTRSEEDALKDLYQKMRPGDPPTVSNARQMLKRVFFDERRYDLGRVGRYKIQQKLSLGGEQGEVRTLMKEDIVEGIRYLINLRQGEGNLDDIDHLGSRRVRTVGELLEAQCRVGLARTERLVRERMTIFDAAVEKLTPQKLINPKALSSVIRDFFGRSQLSQFMDQTNPLSEMTHKRRLSALGPGGLSRERAGFEVRDVHSSHYGRICPIETPEGPNIGLISSLSMYARVNDFGFIESPYRKVVGGRVTDTVAYLSADQEEKFVIAQANAPLDDKSCFVRDRVSVRYRGDFLEVSPEKVDYMDVSPKQLVSVAAGLIPFLEHDDANRALMGSNMMRQAVPLLKSERPYVGTGNEGRVARDSRVLVLAEEAGKVAYVSASKILVSKTGEMPEKKTPAEDYQVYDLRKFMRSNAGTCINQRPVVKTGDRVRRGDVLADASATDGGELALGRNVLVAFMPWCGYNFEDAIIISEKLVKEDVYTSIHIEEFECGARDTKLGPEEITRDIPNVGEEALKNLTHGGVVRIGAEVKPGDILVGKITPKSETELAPEERLLRAIFGEKAADVRDTSLRVPSGTSGIVMDVKVSSRNEGNQTKLTAKEKRRQRKQIEDEYKARRQDLTDNLTEALSNILLGEKIPLDVKNADTGEVIIPANRKITKTLLRKLSAARQNIAIDPSPIQIKIQGIVNEYNNKFAEVELDEQASMDRIESGDEVDAGIIKQVKVYVATKKKLSVGDKMAGRHGNKGVIARIVPEEDMPFLPDGSPVEIVLNPLGVPSRMNVGQVLETHLGLACKKLGLHAATPIFDGIAEKQIWDLMDEALQQEDTQTARVRGEEQPVWERGKAVLYDGRNGEPFHQRVVVGVIYMLKLHHLVTDKIHARAVGPYSLVTQQPLGGKAQYGGQRFGEMEVWALEAYGAAYALQEILTVKSDDISGRTRIYESIVKGENTLSSGTPESFNVLMKEMQSLCLDIRVNRGRA
jgi:DNA-directed RNA polymerase subunit beta